MDSSVSTDPEIIWKQNLRSYIANTFPFVVFSSGMSNLDKKIAEDYKKWKRNVNFLYDFVLTHMLEWPSTVIQWTRLPVDTQTEKARLRSYPNI